MENHIVVEFMANGRNRGLAFSMVNFFFLMEETKGKRLDFFQGSGQPRARRKGKHDRDADPADSS